MLNIGVELCCSHSTQSGYHPPGHYPTELKHSSRGTMPPHNTVYVPNVSKPDQVWSQSDAQPVRRVSTHPSHSLDVAGIDSTSIESTVDTLDSGFSYDRFHTPHHHNRPILPGDQVVHSFQ